MKYIIIILLFGVLGMFMVEDEQQEEVLYCEMVQIRIDTGDSTLGWPDYKGIYNEVCR